MSSAADSQPEGMPSEDAYALVSREAAEVEAPLIAAAETPADTAPVPSPEAVETAPTSPVLSGARPAPDLSIPTLSIPSMP